MDEEELAASEVTGGGASACTSASAVVIMAVRLFRLSSLIVGMNACLGLLVVL